MDDFLKEAVITSLKEMFEGSHFSICTVDKCLKITKAIPDTDEYNALHTLHCVHWAKMSPYLRDEILKRTLKMISGGGFDLSAVDLVFNKNEGSYEKPHKRKGSLLSLIRR